MKHKLFGSIVAGALMLTLMVRGFAAQEAAVPVQPPAAGFDKLYAGFIGEWVGQLEYRDFSSNQRVFLPTWLMVTNVAL